MNNVILGLATAGIVAVFAYILIQNRKPRPVVPAGEPVPYPVDAAWLAWSVANGKSSWTLSELAFVKNAFTMGWNESSTADALTGRLLYWEAQVTSAAVDAGLPVPSESLVADGRVAFTAGWFARSSS